MTASWSGNPRTWADQETPTALQFNVEFRDRFDFLSVHSHTGADGDGSAAINPDTVTLDDISTPSAPGANKVVVFSESETARVRAGASGSAVDISLATHTHTQASGAENKNFSNSPGGNGTSYGGTLGVTFTPQDSTGTEQHETTHFGTRIFQNANGLSGTVFIRLLKASVQQVEVSAAMPAPINSIVGLQTSFFYAAPAASSTAFDVESKKSGSTNVNTSGSFVLTREGQCL